MIDGVPMVQYGSAVTLDPGTTTYIILYPLPDYAADAELLYEDDVTQNLYLERVRGEVICWWDPLSEVTTDVISWSLLPLGVDYDTVEVLEPFAIPWTYESTEWENLPSWAKRQCNCTTDPYPDRFDHPWWVRVEVKPKRQIGVRKNQWPVLAVRNRNPNERAFVQHTLKAWYR